MLNLGIDQQTTQLITKNTPFTWSKNSSLQYLGIHLTSLSNSLIKVNYAVVQEKLMRIAKYISNFFVSWAGRITQVKMYLLPHILYLFHTIPLPLLSTQLNQLQGLLNAFIWQQK